MNFLTLLLALLALISAIAVDCGEPVCQPGGPYCTFTDAWGQFNYICTIGHLANPDNQTVQLFAYNWTCHEVGYYPSIDIGKTFDFISQPKSVPSIKFNDTAYPPSFEYESKRYGQNATRTKLPDAICYNSGGSQACEVQFDCGREVNMGDFEGRRKWRQAIFAIEELTVKAYN